MHGRTRAIMLLGMVTVLIAISLIMVSNEILDRKYTIAGVLAHHGEVQKGDTVIEDWSLSVVQTQCGGGLDNFDHFVTVMLQSGGKALLCVGPFPYWTSDRYANIMWIPSREKQPLVALSR